MTTFKVGYLVGSLATASINRKLAKALVRLAPPQLDMVEVPFRDLPIYSYDYDADFPAPARAYVEELLPDVLEGRLEPGRVFDRVATLDEVPDGYRAMNDRESIKVMVTP